MIGFEVSEKIEDYSIVTEDDNGNGEAKKTDAVALP